MSINTHDLATPVIVQRWKRWGHDRAYVKVGEQDLGYRDLLTGDVHCPDATHADTVASATASMWTPPYVARHAMPDEPAPAPPGRPRPTPAMLPDRDLASNVPGEQARRQATELRDAAPVRTFFARAVGAKTDERAWRIGAEGEAEVARRLLKLGPEWRVLHAVPVGDRGSDIDHVVIGPAGVFTVNTKNHPQAKVWVAGDTVKINGYYQPYVRNSRFEAQRAATLLSAAAQFDVEVHGVVAIMGGHGGFTVKEQPRDGVVSVVTRKQVAAHLQSRPVVLGAPSIDRIYEVARHLATWQPKTVAWQDFDLMSWTGPRPKGRS